MEGGGKVVSEIRQIETEQCPKYSAIKSHSWYSPLLVANDLTSIPRSINLRYVCFLESSDLVLEIIMTVDRLTLLGLKYSQTEWFWMQY